MIDFFIKRSHEIFHFLEQEFGCKIIDTKKHGYYGAEIICKNQTTAIKILFEPREYHVFITLYRLIDGDLPKYKNLWEYDNDLKYRFGFDDLISLRAPSLKVEHKFGPPFTENDLEIMLVKYANALKLCASDVLRGDFKVFPELAKIVTRRIGEYKKKR